MGPRNHVLDGVEITHEKGHFRGGVDAVGKYGNSQHPKNGSMLAFAAYINGQILASAVYRCTVIV